MARSASLKGYKRLPGHRYHTPRGKIISEYQYRTIKAKRAGFRNYTQQRRFRDRPEFQKLRFDVLSQDAGADVGPGGELEAQIVELIRHREDVGAGNPAEEGTGHMVGHPGERFSALLEKLGLPYWWKWKYWYSEVAIG